MMKKQGFHPSDQTLLMAADGELSSRRAARVRGHLAACWNCRARMADIEATIAAFVRSHHRSFDSQLPPIAGARALLRAQLEELAREPKPRSLHQFQAGMKWVSLAFACGLAVLLVVNGAQHVAERRVTYDADTARTRYQEELPNPSLTPGVVRSVQLAEVCTAEHDEVVRPVSATVEQKVFQEYGIPRARPTDYEIDFLITPGLGGSDDLRNLWPEPHSNAVWNSYAKDQLEDHLHSMVCGGKLSLSAAQTEIASNWISAYMKYFHTDKPLPDKALNAYATGASGSDDGSSSEQEMAANVRERPERPWYRSRFSELEGTSLLLFAGLAILSLVRPELRTWLRVAGTNPQSVISSRGNRMDVTGGTLRRWWRFTSSSESKFALTASARSV